VEKEKLEMKQNNKSEDAKMDSYEMTHLKNQILREISEKKELEEKIKEIKEDFLVIKSDMGGLNATQQVQERYEKHIKILENRLDKANQKFNESIEYDKKLRDEIDKLRKERFFFENIYKKLEKELEKLRKEISINLENAYENYESKLFLK
jgi:chromosome segregation ATPase